MTRVRSAVGSAGLAGRVVSASATALQNSERSAGTRPVMRWPSVTAGTSSTLAPEFRDRFGPPRSLSRISHRPGRLQCTPGAVTDDRDDHPRVVDIADELDHGRWGGRPVPAGHRRGPGRSERRAGMVAYLNGEKKKKRKAISSERHRSGNSSSISSNSSDGMMAIVFASDGVASAWNGRFHGNGAA